MKWFKHDTDASNDPKIKKLKKKFGMTGYGIYFNLLELVARKMEDRIDEFGYLPDDWDDESLEIEFGQSMKTLVPILDYIIDIGLFERKDTRMYNAKIQSRCDDYTARIIRNKAQIIKSPNTVRTKSDKVSLDKNRIEENRGEKKGLPIGNVLLKGNEYKPDYNPPKRKPKILTAKQKIAVKRLQALSYFHEQGVKNGFDYLEEEDDQANRKFIGLARSFEKRYPENWKEVINWWFKGDNAWCDYHPSNFFSISNFMKFDNAKNKKKSNQVYYN